MTVRLRVNGKRINGHSACRPSSHQAPVPRGENCRVSPTENLAQDRRPPRRNLQQRLLFSIATDEKGVIQIFNVGAERMLGYLSEDVVNRITPSDISAPAELIARAAVLSLELNTPITPGV